MDNLTHWKKLENPDYLGAYAFEPGKDMIVTITGFKANQDVCAPSGQIQKRTLLTLAEYPKPMILNRTNATCISKILQTKYLEEWVGHKIQLYIVPNCKYFGELWDVIRVRPFLPKDESFICFDCKGEIKAYGKMSPKALSLYTQKAYGRALCSECATKAKAAQENAGGDCNG